MRFIQDSEYRPLKSTAARKADVRLIAATNADLSRLVQHGKFRQDLYYRLNVISFYLPPLRERRDDVCILARHFLDKYATQFNKRVAGLTPEAMQKLRIHDWPGNVRELENVIERTVVLAGGDLIQAWDIVLPDDKDSTANDSFQCAKRRVIDQFERNYIEAVLLSTNGNISEAAVVAQKNRRAFWQLIQKHRIDANTFRNHRQPTGPNPGPR